MTIRTPWPELTVYARDAGEIDPYAPDSAPRFRGEEAFAQDVTGWRRWSKPSPEPRLDEAFKQLVLASIELHRAPIAASATRLAQAIQDASPRPPVLIAILRAGVPVAHLLSKLLADQYAAPIPVAAISLFQGLGWDEEALRHVLATYPDAPVWFIDGWTSKGGVATELRHSYERWLAKGYPDFTNGKGPQLGVLCDPGRFASAAGLYADSFVPSSCFTAPETLGFSRGFAETETGMLSVYSFPHTFFVPEYITAWERVISSPVTEVAPVFSEASPLEQVPSTWRLHVNEVARALINRMPREIAFDSSEAEARQLLAPVVYLAEARGVPLSFDCQRVRAWGAIAAARME